MYCNCLFRRPYRVRFNIFNIFNTFGFEKAELQGEDPSGAISDGHVREEGEDLRLGDVYEGRVAEDISTEDAGQGQVVEAHVIELRDPVQQLPELLVIVFKGLLKDLEGPTPPAWAT